MSVVSKTELILKLYSQVYTRDMLMLQANALDSVDDWSDYNTQVGVLNESICDLRHSILMCMESSYRFQDRTWPRRYIRLLDTIYGR